MSWAPPTWFFFHSFAMKINENFYQHNQNECLGIIIYICQNLPCPKCLKHADLYLKKNITSLLQPR